MRDSLFVHVARIRLVAPRSSQYQWASRFRRSRIKALNRIEQTELYLMILKLLALSLPLRQTERPG